MNQAMLVALAMDIRNSFRIPLEKKDSVIHGLLLKWHQEEYIDLFSKLINGRSDWLATRKLIDQIFKKNMGRAGETKSSAGKLNALAMMLFSVSRWFL